MLRKSRIVPLSMLLVLGIASACGSPVGPAGTGEDETRSPLAVAEASSAPTDQPTERATRTPTEEPTERATEEPTEEPTEAPTATTAPYTDTLPAEYLQDSDDNLVPDFLETELGYDPLSVDCWRDCPDAAPGSEIDLDTNVLVLFDSSGSMAGMIGEQRKIDIAKQAVGSYLRVVGKNADVGLLVYGHKGNNTDAGKAESCPGVELLAPLGQANDSTADGLIGRFEPTGWTPIAGALEAAEGAFAGREGQGNRIIIVSDGEETCEGDPVAVARRLFEQGFNVQIDVIGFDLENQTVVDQMKAIAAAGGGVYYDAQTEDQLQQYLLQQLDAMMQTRSAAACNVGYAAVASCDDLTVLLSRSWLFNKAEELEDSDPIQAAALRELRDAIEDRYIVRREWYGERQRVAARLNEELKRMREELKRSMP